MKSFLGILFIELHQVTQSNYIIKFINLTFIFRMAKILYLIFIIIILVCKSHETNETLNGTNNLVNSTVAIIGTGNIHLNKIYDGVNGIKRIFNETDVYEMNSTDDASNITNELSQIFDDETINSPKNSIFSLAQNDVCTDIDSERYVGEFPNNLKCLRGKSGSLVLCQREAFKFETTIKPNITIQPTASIPNPTPMYEQVN